MMTRRRTLPGLLILSTVVLVSMLKSQPGVLTTGIVSTPAVEPPLTFVLQRDVSDNAYHAIIWHCIRLMQAAVAFDVHMSDAHLVLLDAQPRGPLFELYQDLGYRRIDLVGKSEIDTPCRVSHEDLASITTFEKIGSCVLVPADFYQVAHVHKYPRTETYFRAKAPEVYALRSILRQKYCKNFASLNDTIVYVRRSHSRRIHNELEFTRVLETPSKNVLTVELEKMSIAEQAGIFCRAQIIVGVHGAGLTWSLLSEAGSVLLEIFPYGWSDPCYRNIARIAGLSYFAYQNLNESAHDETTFKGRGGITTIDLHGFANILESSILASENSGEQFSPPCKDAELSKPPLQRKQTCPYTFDRRTGERIWLENV